MKRQLMTLFFGVTTLFISSYGNTKIAHDTKNELRAPAYPLVTIDPYTSGWSFNDHLYDGTIKH